MISLVSKNPDETETLIEIHPDQGSSLMELLVNNNYPVLATCGGMALCGTCCIDIIENSQPLPSPEDDEIIMLDSLPHSNKNSRLSCQLKLTQDLDGLIFRLNSQD